MKLRNTTSILNYLIPIFLILLFIPGRLSAQVEPVKSGYAPVNGLELYYEIYGEGEPMILIHGGLGSTGMFQNIMPQLSQKRQVIAIDLQGHGRTADIDRPLRYENFADDIAEFIKYLGHEKVDIVGYSMGAGAGLRTAIQHPGLVKRLVAVSAGYKRDGFYPEILAMQSNVNAEAADDFMDTPIYQNYAAIAPDPGQFPELLDKIGELMSRDYDWADEIRNLKPSVMLIFADADMFPTSHVADFFGLLGGGQQDAGWDGSMRPDAQLAILPDLTHYDIHMSPLLATVVNRFLEDSNQTDSSNR